MGDRGRRPPLDSGTAHRPTDRGGGGPLLGGQVLLLEPDDLVARRVTRRLGAADGLGLSFVRCRSVELCLPLAATTAAAVCVADVSADRPIRAIETIESLSAALSVPLVAIVRSDGPRPVVAVRSGADEVVVADDDGPDLDALHHAVAMAMARSHRSARPGAAARVGSPGADVPSPAAGGPFDDFARMLAHDLRAPVRTARRHLRDARRSGPPGDAGADDAGPSPIDRAERALVHLDELIVSVLDFATIGAVDLDLEPIELAGVAEDAVEALAADLAANGGTVVVDVDPSITVLAQGPQLARLFLNLIGNAIRHAQRGSGLVIAISATTAPGLTTIRVADNGVGIPAEEAELVFTPLYRADAGPSTATSAPGGAGGAASGGLDRRGLGLGLALCARIVANAGGVIRCVPGYGPGATFEVTLLSPLDGGRS